LTKPTNIAIGIGLHKCGTSWLYKHLEAHSDVCMHQRDTHFFLKDEKFKRGIQFYEDGFKERGKKLNVEMSTGYFSDPTALSRIKELYPHAKLFVSIRNPVDRLVSHIRQNLKTGSPVDIGISLSPGSLPSLRGKYKEHFENLFQLFPKEQVHIVLFDQIYTEPLQCMNGLLEFLEIDTIEEDQGLSKVVNPSRQPKSLRIEQLQNKAYFRLQQSKTGLKFWNLVRKLGLGKLVQNINSSSSETFVKVSNEQFDALYQFYEEDILYVKNDLGFSALDWRMSL